MQVCIINLKFIQDFNIYVICIKNRCYYIRNRVVVLIEILLFVFIGVLLVEDFDNSFVFSCYVEEVYR